MTMTDIVTAFGVDLFINKKGNYDIRMSKEKKGETKYLDIERLIELKRMVYEKPQLEEKEVQV